MDSEGCRDRFLREPAAESLSGSSIYLTIARGEGYDCGESTNLASHPGGGGIVAPFGPNLRSFRVYISLQ